MSKNQSNLFHLCSVITTQETFNSVDEFLRCIKIDACEYTSEKIKNSFDYNVLHDFVTNTNQIYVYSKVCDELPITDLQDENHNFVGISAPCCIVDDDTNVFIILKTNNK